MDNINFNVEKILKEINKDNFGSLSIAAQIRVLKELDITIDYITAFKDNMPQISFESLIKKLKDKRYDLKIVHHTRVQRPLYRYE